MDNLKLLLFHLSKKQVTLLKFSVCTYPYKEAFVDIVEEDEVAEHGDEAEESETSDNVDHNIFQIKLSFNISFLSNIGLIFQQQTCSALYDDDKLDPIGLLEILL